MHKYVYTATQLYIGLHVFSWPITSLYHIHETVGNLGLWISCVLTFHSHYGPRNDDEVHIFGCADIFSLLQYPIKLKNGLKIHTL